MSRQRTSSSAVPWMVATALLAITVVFAALLGPKRAASIALAAVSSTLVDDLYEGRPTGGIRTLSITVGPEQLDSLNSDLPWSGATNIGATVRIDGVDHPARFRYRGALTPSHFLGEKRSFRLTFRDAPPQFPFRKVNVINPKSFNMLNNHLGLWVGGWMGVPVPHDELVQVEVNGRPWGVMELYEQPGDEFLRTRGLCDERVALYKGDFGPVRNRTLGARNLLWQKAAFWQFQGRADSTMAHERLSALIRAVNARDLSVEARADSLARLLNMEVYLRYLAAMWVVNTAHIDQYHNQFLVLDPRDGRFLPVLWDALLMYEQPGAPRYFIHDALAYRVLQVPEWRVQRDRFAWQALQELHRKGIFRAKWDAVEAQVRPHLLADRNKYANVTLMAEDVHRYSMLHAMRSGQGMQLRVQAYWDGLMERLERCRVQEQRSGNDLVLSTADECPLEVSWSAADTVQVAVLLDGVPMRAEEVEGRQRVVIHRDVEHSRAEADIYQQDQQFKVLPLKATLTFVPAIPASVRIANAITHAPVE